MGGGPRKLFLHVVQVLHVLRVIKKNRFKASFQANGRDSSQNIHLIGPLISKGTSSYECNYLVEQRAFLPYRQNVEEHKAQKAELKQNSSKHKKRDCLQKGCLCLCLCLLYNRELTHFVHAGYQSQIVHVTWYFGQ